MYRRILVAADGSENGLKAVAEAARLAAAGPSDRLDIVHVMLNPATLVAGTAPDGYVIGDDVYDLLRAEGRRILDEARKEAARLFGGSIETHLVTGSPAVQVEQVAKDLGSDLLVVGSRGLSRVERFFLGSVSGQLVHRSPCSVLVVRG